MSNQSCTCSDWKDFRQGQNLGDPGRLCSHLARAFRDTLSGQDSVPTHTRVLPEDLDQRGCGGQLDFTWQLLEFQDDKILAGHVGPAPNADRRGDLRGDLRWTSIYLFTLFTLRVSSSCHVSGCQACLFAVYVHKRLA